VGGGWSRLWKLGQSPIGQSRYESPLAVSLVLAGDSVHSHSKMRGSLDCDRIVFQRAKQDYDLEERNDPECPACDRSAL
jgi:hypothetical protein